MSRGTRASCQGYVRGSRGSLHIRVINNYKRNDPLVSDILWVVTRVEKAWQHDPVGTLLKFFYNKKVNEKKNFTLFIKGFPDLNPMNFQPQRSCEIVYETIVERVQYFTSKQSKILGYPRRKDTKQLDLVLALWATHRT